MTTTAKKELQGTSMGNTFHDPFYALLPRRQGLDWAGHRLALVTIDLQYLDAHPDGWMGRLARASHESDLLDERWQNVASILPNVAQLQLAVRKAGQEVIHVRTAFQKPDFRDAGTSYMPSPRVGPVAPVPADDSFLIEVAPDPLDIIVSKRSSSAFNSSDIDDILRRLNIKILILAGIVTDGCVELTARDAADRGYDVTLASDACAASRLTTHRAALERMTEGGLIHAASTARLIGQLTAAVFAPPRLTPGI